MNMHDSWVDKHARSTAHKRAIRAQWRETKSQVSLPCQVIFTRLSPRELDDDNLPSAFKYIRDALSNLLIPGLAPGRADNDKRIKWEYHQEISPKRAIRVQIIPLA